MFRDIDPRSVGYLTGILFSIYLALNTCNAVTLWVRKPANRYVKCDRAASKDLQRQVWANERLTRAPPVPDR